MRKTPRQCGGGRSSKKYESFLGQVDKVGELYLAAAKDAYKPFESKFAEMGVKLPK